MPGTLEIGEEQYNRGYSSTEGVPTLTFYQLIDKWQQQPFLFPPLILYSLLQPIFPPLQGSPSQLTNFRSAYAILIVYNWALIWAHTLVLPVSPNINLAKPLAPNNFIHFVRMKNQILFFTVYYLL